MHQDSAAQSRGERNEHRFGAGEDYSRVMIGRPPSSPNLTPADFLLFPKVKTAFKGRRIADTSSSAVRPHG